MQTAVYEELMTQLRQITDAVKRRDADVERIKQDLLSIAEQLADQGQQQKAMEERVANVERALVTRSEVGLDKLAIQGSTPYEKLENFLSMRSDDPRIKECQDLIDAYTVFALARKARGLSYENSHLHQRFQEILKQVTGTQLPGYIPPQFSTRVVELIRLEPTLRRLFPTVDMKSDTLNVPIMLTGTKVYRVGAGAQIPLSTPTAGQPIEFTAKKIGGGFSVVDEVTEDAAVAVMPLLQQDLAFAFAYGIDDAVVNGDDSATHMDSDVTQANDVRKTWKGLRKIALAGTAKVDFGNSAPTVSLLRQIRAAMGVYAANIQNLVWVVALETYVKLLSIPEVLTVDKYGPQATVITGELGKFDGIPIVISPNIRVDLNASGVYGGTTNNRTVLFLVNRQVWAVAERRGIRVEADRDIISQVDYVVATWRGDFKPLYSANNIIGIGYNVAK
jgi:HK97 family phage major capsid protein